MMVCKKHQLVNFIKVKQGCQGADQCRVKVTAIYEITL